MRQTFFLSLDSPKMGVAQSCCKLKRDDRIRQRRIPSAIERVTPNIEWKDTIPFVVPVTGGRVIKVYDGDTITIATKLPYVDSPLYRISVRLSGIDTPELRTSDESEKSLALLARDSLSDLILNEWVTLQNTDMDKYGRLLADVYIGETHINKWMIEQRFAVPYDGGTKQTPENWMTFYQCSVSDQSPPAK